MRITADPFGSPSTKSTTTSSATSLDTLANAPSPRPPRAINPPALQLQSQLLSNSAAKDTTGSPAPPTETGHVDPTVKVESCSVSISPVIPLQDSPTSQPNIDNNKNDNNNGHQLALKVDTLRKNPLWRSQSSHTLFSPNQLQGVVVESLKTPVNTNLPHHQPSSFHRFGIGASSSGQNDISTHGDLVFEPNSPDQKGIPWMLYRQRSQSTGAISSSGSSMRSSAGMVAGAAASMIASAFGSHVRSTSGTQERQQQHYQQQQQVLASVGSIGTPLESMFGIDALSNQSFPTPAPAPLGKKDVEVEMDPAVEDGEDIRTEQPNAPLSDCNDTRQSSSRPVLLPPSTPVSTISSGLAVPLTTITGGGPWSDDDDQSSSVSTDTELEVDDQAGSLHVHRPARRTNSGRTGGKSHYSAYRRRIQSISQLQHLQLDQQQENQRQQSQQSQAVQQQHEQKQSSLYDFNHPGVDGSTSSILAISTASLATAKRNTQEMDGTHSMHFFNRHLQRVQQQAHGGYGRRPAGHAMDASSPSTFSSATMSPASCTTTTSMHSAMTVGSDTSSYASSATSDFSAITGTTSSSVYALSSSDPSERSISRTTTAFSQSSTLCGNTAASSSNNRTPLRARGVRRFIRWTHLDISFRPFSSSTPEHSEKSGVNRDAGSTTPLQEISSRDNRFYGKGQPTSSITTFPRGSPRRNGKKGPKRPDAKAFFSNERTYMHWIKFGLLLGSMALTLLSFGKSMGMQVGLFLVLVAMSSLVYATTIFHLRDRWMKQFRLDVLYYDRVGPSVLFMALFVAFATNVALTVFKLMSEDGSDDGHNFYNGYQDGPLDI
ncbi:hypothetical protein EC957_011427 [Mortierella hygrophila]|uniref:DUF202 domain-containing protein n=1 Tax=Mortierella hygrophila TaxID=979708 RepID=A0A9P6K867_9FUNG|nr:hypothetical protein EC957_011427 [Mortierella hygrophila]